MSITLEERIAKSKERVAKLEQQKRIKERREREAKKKKDQRRNYILGELVAKVFPEVLRFEPGTKDKNAIEFESFETFLKVLATKENLMIKLKNETNRRLAIKNKTTNL